MSSPTATILSERKAIDPQYELLYIDVNKEVNRIPNARLMLIDGSSPKDKFAISDTAVFEPGKEIEIKLRYEKEKDVTVFKGLVVRHGIEVSGRGSVLSIELKDAAIKLTHPRKSVVFTGQPDSEIIGQLIEKADLKAGQIATTQPKQPEPPELVQYYATDWDFILSRADIWGLVVVADDGEISLSTMEVKGSPKHTFEYGISEIYNFEIEIDGCYQPSSIESIAWDIKTQKLTQASKAKEFPRTQGNLDGQKVADAIGFAPYTLTHPVSVDAKELQAWADARMARSRMAMIRGRLAVPGFADIKPLDVMEVAGVGKRFNGKTLVTGIRHRVSEKGWQTDLQFGLSPEWFSHRAGISETPAAGLLPPVSGLQIGVVDKFAEDPDKEYRVKVILPAIDEKKGAVWARLACPDAGNKRGFFFRPEKGDEVVVGFFNSDPRQPVILGGMYSSKNKPPPALAAPGADNIEKALVTRSGTTIGFIDDKKAAVFIETAEKNKIIFDDDSQTVQISDQHGNAITMDKHGIEIKSANDLKISASGNVEITGKKVDVK
ncbi:MAG: type VI secretion system tip protein VgrG [Proteobacteria bacterium]|nr:type VI secretion system tip protein VgrG [Pseudomonadota bacterium]